MAYTYDFLTLGEKMQTDCCFAMTKDKKYRVYLKDVYTKEKQSDLMHKPISGIGWTFEDACMDFFRLARTVVLYNIINEKYEKVV